MVKYKLKSGKMPKSVKKHPIKQYTIAGIGTSRIHIVKTHKEASAIQNNVYQRTGWKPNIYKINSGYKVIEI